MNKFSFNKYLRSRLNEAINISSNKGLFNASAKEKIEQSTYDVESILPNMSEQGKRYFELMIEGTYEHLLERIKKYTNTNTPDRLAVISALAQSLHTISSIESRHTSHLENLAVQTVLQLDEFKFIRDMIREGNVKIKAKILKPDLESAFQEHFNKIQEDAEKATETELTPGEEAEMNAIDMMFQADKSKAAFANFITQGEAINSMEMFKIVKESLNQIDARLIKLYELYSVAVHAGYFIMPFFDMNGALSSAAGMAKVDFESNGPGPEDDSYTITAHGINFATLLHEIVKGVYDYIGLHAKDQDTLDVEDINDEKLQLMAGPQIAREFKKIILGIIGMNNIQYIQPLYAKLYGPEVTPDEIRSIISRSPQGKQLVISLFNEVKAEQDEFDQGQEEEI